MGAPNAVLFEVINLFSFFLIVDRVLVVSVEEESASIKYSTTTDP